MLVLSLMLLSQATNVTPTAATGLTVGRTNVLVLTADKARNFVPIDMASSRQNLLATPIDPTIPGDEFACSVADHQLVDCRSRTTRKRPTTAYRMILDGVRMEQARLDPSGSRKRSTVYALIYFDEECVGGCPIGATPPPPPPPPAPENDKRL